MFLFQSSAEYKLLCEYVANTHGKTHTNYKLEVEDILEIKREGEAQRFEPSIGNRHLLWHGSRLSNFMGIISQGLRIAPPEAPVTGYMFGKVCGHRPWGGTGAEAEVRGISCCGSGGRP